MPQNVYVCDSNSQSGVWRLASESHLLDVPCISYTEPQFSPLQ